jgi:hypothetical protein
MALIVLGSSRCKLCSRTLDAGDDILGFDDGFVMDYHFLGDAAVHRACFVQWEHRDAFLAVYNTQFPDKRLGSNGRYGRSARDGK